MIDLIMSYIANGLLVTTSLFLFVFLVGRLYPALLLTPRFRRELLCDRGLKKYSYPEGRAIVYEPPLDAVKYVPQYILYSLEGAKYIKCKLDINVSSIRYDVVAFDRKGKHIETLCVCEPIEKKGYTCSVKLPGETSFVSLQLLDVNGKRVAKVPHEKIAPGNVFIYFALTLATTLAESAIIREVLLFFASLSTSEAVDTSKSGALSLFAAILLGLACAGLTLLAYKKKDVTISKN